MHRSVLRGIVLIVIAVAVIVGLALLPTKRAHKNHPPNLDPWVLVSYDPDNPYGTYLGNGFISTRIMGEGVGSHNGEPLPCYMAGLYDDEKLIPTPTWSDLRFYDGKTEFKIDKDADYRQTLDMKTGILTTEATWRAGGKALKGSVEVLVCRWDQVMARVCASLSSDFDGVLRVEAPTKNTSEGIALAEGRVTRNHDVSVATYTTRGGKTTIALATRLVSTTANSYSFSARGNDIEQSCRVAVSRQRPFVISRYSAAAPSGAWNARQWAFTELAAAVLAGPALADRHRASWAKLWKNDIVIDGPVRDQQALRSCMFYLLQSVREGSQWSIPPMGLSNNAFSGHVFWDADTWMFPALILQHPELARVIVDYRYNTLSGAMANAKAHGFAGAEYAWESGYTGKEDTPPGLVYRFERHINGDVALAQWQYYLATNDLKWLRTRGYPVIKATADYWVSRVKLNAAKGRYEILQVVPPDENAELVNNSVYTNAIAKMNLEIAGRAASLAGLAANPKWAQVASKMYIPFDSAKKRFMAYDGYKGQKAKQADAELLAYPLQFKLAGQSMTEIYRNTLSYYAPKVMPMGPAMSSSAHSVIAARLDNCDEAYAKFLDSYRRFLRGPFNYFNEKRSTTLDNMCFLTGAAGPAQAALFGLAGARMDYLGSPELTWSPCLPKQWKSVRITGVQWRGRTFDVVVTRGKKVELRGSGE